MSNLVLCHVTKLFAANKLVLNLDKTNIMKFITKNSSNSALHIRCKENFIEEMVSTKFLVLETDYHQKWKINIGQMIPKLSAACYAIRSMVHISKINTPKSIYYA
jgi:acetylglutamate kinase